MVRLLFKVKEPVVIKVAGFNASVVLNVKFVVGEPGAVPKLLSELTDKPPTLMMVPPE